jgi:hypothetical protein
MCAAPAPTPDSLPDRPSDKPVSDALLRETILRMTAARGTAKSICPSEVARGLANAWQGLMTRVRRQAEALAQEGRIEILRKGKPVEPRDVKGVIRLRLRDTGEEG